MRRLITIFILVLCGLPLGARAGQVEASLVSQGDAITPGTPIRIGVLLSIKPGWHVYWINPGDAGLPTTVKWQLPAGWKASPLLYPVPEKIIQPGGIISYGYENEVMLYADITPGSSTSEKDIQARVDYLVCEAVCVPGHADLRKRLPGEIHSDVEMRKFSQWQLRLPTDAKTAKAVIHFEQSSQVEKNTSRLNFTIDWPAAAPKDAEWFPPASQVLNFKSIAVKNDSGKTSVQADVERLDGKSEPINLDSVIGYGVGEDRRGIIVTLQLK